MKNKVVLGLSGGVDSAVSAALLLEQGYDVQPVFMQNWEADQDDPYCTLSQDLEDAHAVCQTLGLQLETVNFAKAYWDHVFQNFLDAYAQGLTPNPDILCNSEIKFKAFLNYALDQGASHMATGHYARLKRLDDGTTELRQAVDTNKDQTYFLYRLNQHQLQHALFPLGELTKPEVRTLAQKLGLPNQAKKDSTGICFIGERRFKSFLKEYLLGQPGDIVDLNGKIIGKHEGMIYYTLGQRKGLQIGGVQHAGEAPWYVIKRDATHNRLIVSQDKDDPALYSATVTCQQTHWVAGQAPSHKTYQARIRHRQALQNCRITETNGATCVIAFEQPQRAAAPGQSLVLYDGLSCLGGGIIT